jgi:hypothetical protein
LTTVGENSVEGANHVHSVEFALKDEQAALAQSIRRAATKRHDRGGQGGGTPVEPGGLQAPATVSVTLDVAP